MRVIPAHARKATLIVALLTSVAPVAVLANPVDGTVAAGSASIASSGSTLTVNQVSDKAVIDWRGFDVGAGETTNFVQPSSHALTLNRVGSGGASRIDGNVTANGNIVIVNPNGIVFGAGSHVDVNGLVATTANISNANAMAGNLRFDQAGNPTARIENHGSITARDAGLVGLVAPNVINSGIITARLGRVHLASGDTATVDLYGDGLIEVKASDALTHQLVANTGTLSAQGGTIALTAAAGRETVDSLVQVSGLLDARSIGTRDGHIFIYAQGAPATSNAAVQANVGRVVIAGTLDVSNASGNGGRVEVAGRTITLAPTAIIDANGTTGGGIVRIGADVQGSAIIAPVLTGEMQGPALPTADEIIMQAGSSITANALTHGNGGTVVLYADTRTEFGGTITADGAGTNGEGGFVETSGRVALTVNGGTVSATGRRKNGTWLLDPADITITGANANSTNTANTFTATNTGSTIAAATIKSILDGGTNVTIQTSNDGFAGNGDITVSSAITTTGAGSLTLSAYRDINVNAAITLQGGALTLQANNADTNIGRVSIAANIATNGGNITIGGGSNIATGYAYGYAGGIEGILLTSATVDAGNGTIIARGHGYDTGSNAHGIYINGGTVRTTGATANISLTGVGGAGVGSQSIGIYFKNAGVVSTTDGTLTLHGTGGGSATADQGFGVAFSSVGANSVRTTGAGNITVTGIGGSGSNGFNAGIIANKGNSIQTSGTGSITLNGIAGAGTGSFGVSAGAGNAIATTGSSGARAITVYTDTISLAQANNISSAGVLTIAPYSNIGISIGVVVGSTLNISTASLAFINGASYVLGSATTGTNTANTGNISISTTNDFAGKNVTFLSGNDIRINGAYTATGIGALTLSAMRDLNVANSITLAGGSLLLRADNTGIGLGGISASGAIATNGGNITMGGGSGAITGAILNMDGTIGTLASGYALGGGQSGYGIGITNTLNAGGGNIIINGKGVNSGTNSNYGVFISGALSNSGAGNININGVGQGTSSSDIGVYLNSSSLTHSGTGSTIITGIGGGTGINNNGIFTSNETINVASGNLSLVGTGGGASTTGNTGINISNSSSISSSGGNITIHGTTGADSNNAYGVYVTNSTVATTGNGTITVKGAGLGQTTSTGVRLNAGGVISTASGALTIDGTGGTGGGAGSGSYGVLVGGTGSTISTTGGLLKVTGAGGQGSGGDNSGIYLTSANGIQATGANILLYGIAGAGSSYGLHAGATNGIKTTTSGTISVYADSMNLTVASAINSASTLTLAPYSNIGMSIGTSVVGTYNVSNALLANILGADYIFGSTTTGTGTANTGDVTINTTMNFVYRSLTFISGNTIALAGTLTKGSGTGAVTYRFYANNDIINTSSAGINAAGNGTINVIMQSNYDDNAAGGAIKLSGGSIISSGGNITLGGGSAPVTTGVGYAQGNAGYASGVWLINTITAAGGNIIINGKGNANASSGAHGVYLNGSTVTTTGTGTIAINGSGGGTGVTSSVDTGIFMNNNAVLSTVNGNINLTGTGGGTGSGGSNYGLATSMSGASILTTGLGNITVSGTGGAGTAQSYGLGLHAVDGIKTTGSGNITIYAASPASVGIAQDVAISNAVRTTGTGSITVYTNSLAFLAVNALNSATSLTLAAYTNIGMGVGTSAGGAFNISNTQLNYLNAASYIFGAITTGNGTTSTGDVTINTNRDFGASNVSFIAGQDINIAGTLTKASGGNATYLFQANRDIYNTNNAGVTSSAGALNLTFNADYDQATVAGGRIAFTNGSFTSNNGNIVLGGGLDATTGYAQGRTGAVDGVNITGATVNSGDGALTVHGRGYGTGAATNSGVSVNTAGALQSANGNVAISGTAGNSSGNVNNGVYVTGTNSVIQSTGNGTVTVNGIGAGSGGDSAGIFVESGGKIATTTNTLALNASSTSSGVFGVDLRFNGNATVTSTTGNIIIKLAPYVSLYVPLRQDFPTGTIGGATTSGNITLYEDVYTMPNIVQTTGTFNLARYTNADMNISGNVTGVTAGTFVIGALTNGNGSANTSNINITGATNLGASNVSFISPGNIALNGTITKSTGAGTANYLLQANGNITNSGSAGIVATSGAINLTLSSDNDVSGAGSITLTSAPLSVNGGTITLNSHGRAITQSGSIGGNETINSANGAVSIGALDGDTAGTRNLTVNAGTAIITTTGSIGGTNKLNNLTFSSADIAIGGDLYGAGILLFDPFNPSNVLVGSSLAGQFNIDNTEVARIKAGWSEMQIGHVGGGLNEVQFFNTSLNTNLRVRGNARNTFITGTTLTTTNGASLTFEDGLTKIFGDVNADGSINFTTTSSTNSYLHGTLTSQNGNISFNNNIYLSNGNGDGSLTLNAVNGTVTLKNVQSTTTSTGNFAVSAMNVVNTATLGTVAAPLVTATLTATNSVVLPAIYSKAVNITVTGAGNSITANNTIITGAFGNITLTSDDLILGANLSGTGTLMLQPYATTRVANVNYGAADGTNWNLSTAEIARFTNGWGSIIIGRSDAGGAFPAGYMNIGASTWIDPTTFRGLFDNIYGTIAGTGNASFTFDNGAYASEFLTDNASVTTQGGAITFGGLYLGSANNALTSNGGAIYLGFLNDVPAFGSIGTFNVNSSNGNITTNGIFTGGANSGLYNFNAGTGTLAFAGAVDTTESVTATANTITFAGAWGGTTPVGNVTLTSLNSLTLPAITTAAGKTLNITVTGTGNSITANNAIATGTGGTLTLTADDLTLGGDLSGTGTLTLQPYSTAQQMRIGGSYTGSNAGYLTLSNAELVHILNGWSNINLGRTNTLAGNYQFIGDSTWNDSVNFRGWSDAITGNVAAGQSDVDITFSGSLGARFSTDNASVTTLGGNVAVTNPYFALFSKNNSITTNGGDLNLGNTVVQAGVADIGNFTVSTAGGDIQLGGISAGAQAGNAYRFTAGAGNVTFGSIVNTAADVIVSGNTATLNAAWGGTTTLGNVSLITTDTLALPSITATSILAQSTGIASDITINSGATLTATGTGNALTLASGRNFINNSGASALSAVSGRWLVYSQDPANDVTGGLSAFATDYSHTYALNAPATIGSGNRFEVAAAIYVPPPPPAPPAPPAPATPMVTDIPDSVTVISQDPTASLITADGIFNDIFLYSHNAAAEDGAPQYVTQGTGDTQNESFVSLPFFIQIAPSLQHILNIQSTSSDSSTQI